MLFTCRENTDDIPLMLRASFAEKERLYAAFKHWRAHFAFSVGLASKAEGSRLADASTIWLTELEEEYPPSGHDIYELAAIRQLWEQYHAAINFPDARGSWKPYHRLDPARLQHTVEEDVSTIIRDTKTNEIICVVIRNFSNGNNNLLDWINSIIKENNGARRSIRVSSIPELYLNSLP